MVFVLPVVNIVSSCHAPCVHCNEMTWRQEINNGVPKVYNIELSCILLMCPGQFSVSDCTAVMCFTYASQARHETGCPWILLELVSSCMAICLAEPYRTHFNILGKY